MEWLKNKNGCCGCGACAQICPRNCIEMREDPEGFRYPIIDDEKCIGCRACEETCPAIHRRQREGGINVYAAVSKDRELVNESSSGGMFGVLARYILDRDGVVFGAAFDEEMNLIHCGAQSEAECAKFHGSKYIQSNTKDTFAECRQYLDAGRYVLYTGTPCQIAGLKQYLHKEYERLFAVEVICHGVPSPAIWKRYIEELEGEAGEKIIHASFRDKDEGWKIYRFKAEYENGSETVIPGVKSPYFAAFLNNLTLRPSCYECRYRIDHSRSDLMIGDFWGIGNYSRNFDERLGVSALFILSAKGEQIFQEIQKELYYEKSDINKVIPMNGCLRLSVFPNRNRSKVMESYAGTSSISEVLGSNLTNYCWGERKYNIGVWGSYNSRLVVQFLINGSGNKRIFHFSNSSVVSVMSEEKLRDSEFEMTNQYRKDALTADWGKHFRKQFDKLVDQMDYILIDMLEERFDLLKQGDTYITQSDALKDLNVNLDMENVTQGALLKTDIWNEKMQQFVKMLKSRLPDSKIIVLELYLSETYYDGEEYKEFPDVREIREINGQLKRIYELFYQYCPKAYHIKLEQQFQYAAYNHRYGCIPSHLNYMAYFELADRIYDIMVGKDE